MPEQPGPKGQQRVFATFLDSLLARDEAVKRIIASEEPGAHEA